MEWGDGLHTHYVRLLNEETNWVFDVICILHTHYVRLLK